MLKIERFEDFIAWQKARELTRAIYETTQQGSVAKDLGLSWLRSLSCPTLPKDGIY